MDTPKPPRRPYAFVQWKGTDLCADVHCTCGALLHFDGDFAYALSCPHCKAIFETPWYVALNPVTESEHRVIEIEAANDDFDG